MGLEVLIPIFGIMIVLVPVVGFTLIMTMRLAGKPLVETIARELRASGYTSASELQLQVTDLNEQVELLSAEVRRLKEADAFDRRLMSGNDADEPEP